MNFNMLKIGTILENIKSKVKYQITEQINDEVFEMNNLKYLGVKDYINKNTINDYNLIKE